ncbi:MAG: hypothetical protein KKH08_03735, partial [Candidatus Omnitrophica bacterium]|nr:hypothetical protein [Candidatus Omnitrophota bacterium]
SKNIVLWKAKDFVQRILFELVENIKLGATLEEYCLKYSKVSKLFYSIFQIANCNPVVRLRRTSLGTCRHPRLNERG